MKARWHALLIVVVLAIAAGESAAEEQALPSDYRDLVHALLLDFLQQSGFRGAEHRYFVNVFGSDIDAALVAKLHESGVDVLPGSAWRQPKQIERHGPLIKIDVRDIKKVDDDTYTVGIGYYCGSLCASASTYTMHRDGTSWRVIDRQMRWIASTGELRDATQSS
jgi:hypothetical protein